MWDIDKYIIPDTSGRLWVDEDRDRHLGSLIKNCFPLIDRSAIINRWIPVESDLPPIRKVINCPSHTMISLIDIHGRLVIVNNSDINIVNLQLPPIKDVIPASNKKGRYHIILTEDDEVFETDNMTNPTIATKIRDNIRHIINHEWYIIMIDNNDVIHFEEQSIQSHHPIRLINRNVIVLDNDDVYELEICTRLYLIRLRGNKLIHKMRSISKLVVDSWYILIANDKNQCYLFDRDYATSRRPEYNNPPRKFGISAKRLVMINGYQLIESEDDEYYQLRGCKKIDLPFSIMNDQPVRIKSAMG